MTTDHHTWHLRILGYEDLDGDARRETAEHLAGCRACRDLLDRVQEIERGIGAAGALPPLEAAESRPLDSATHAAADISLRELRRRVLDQPQPARAPRQLWAKVAFPLAMAALAALVLLSPRLTERRIEVRGLGIMPGGQDRGAPADAPMPRVWRSGEAFRLHLSLSRDGYPVVGHLDPRGRFELLYPDPAAGSPRRFARGEEFQLPPEESVLDWVFEGEPGRETFFVAATAKPEFDQERLTQDAASLHDETADRATLVNLTRAFLEARLGPVQLIEVEHAP